MARFTSSVKLRQLEYFVAVAEALHFTRAARALAVTQPTLSHQIAELEARIGVPLFDRLGKTVRLTQAGALFRTHAVSAIAELEAGRAALDELEGMLRGTLRIGVIQSFSRTLLPPILGAFMTAHPAIRLQVEEMTASEIEQQLVTGRLDLGIAFARTETERCAIEPVLEEELLLVVGLGHRLRRRARLAMAALDGERLAMLSGAFATRRTIDHYLALAGARPEIVCETNSIEVILGAVAEGDAAAIIPEKAIGPRSAGLHAIHLHDPTPLRRSALLWPHHSHRSAAARRFAALVQTRLLGPPAP